VPARHEPLHAARLEGTNPVEELATADAHLLGNLRRTELACGRQTHGQEPLLGFDVLTTRQRRRHGWRQVGPVQMKSLRHNLTCHTLQQNATTNKKWYKEARQTEAGSGQPPVAESVA
jgi:hypothetical protein